MKKRVLSGLLVFTMVTGVLAIPGKAQAASVAATAKKALVAKAEKVAVEEARERGLEVGYGLYDMNSDGVKELILSYSDDGESIEWYRYDKTKKKVVQMKLPKSVRVGSNHIFNGVMWLKKEKKGLTVVSSTDVDNIHICTLKMDKKGNLATSNVYKADYKKSKFTKNGKKITEKVFEAYNTKVGKKKEVAHNTSVAEATKIINESALELRFVLTSLPSVFAEEKEYTTYDVTLTVYGLDGKQIGEPIIRAYEKGKDYGETTIGKFDMKAMALLDTEEVVSHENYLLGEGEDVFETSLRGSNLNPVAAGLVELPAGADIQGYEIRGRYEFAVYGTELRTAEFTLINKETKEEVVIAKYEFVPAFG